MYHVYNVIPNLQSLEPDLNFAMAFSFSDMVGNATFHAEIDSVDAPIDISPWQI